MELNDINRILGRLADDKANGRNHILTLAAALIEWTGLQFVENSVPRLLDFQTLKLKEALVGAPVTGQEQLYRLTAENQPVRVRFAVFKKYDKKMIHYLVDGNVGLASYQAAMRGIKQIEGREPYVARQPYFIHFIATAKYDRLWVVFNDGEQKRVLVFRNRLTQTQFSKIMPAWHNIAARPKPEMAKLFWSSLDVKEVNKDFYQHIKERFDALTAIAKTQEKHLEESVIKQFAVRLIGRYIFCWFLKEKEIIPEALIASKTIEKYRNIYFQQCLAKLFFNTLNAEVTDRARNLAINDDIDVLYKNIPYLNGGLFDWHPEDELFEKLDLNAWLIDFVKVLESFDFTVDESSSQYQQVAIDPEMLGRIFENLLASQNPDTEKMANQRKAFGAFYTPREIVDYMVNESLKAYLENQLLPQLPEQANVVRESQVAYNDPLFQHLEPPKPIPIDIDKSRIADIERRRERIKTKIDKLFVPDCADNPFDKEETIQARKALSAITILDPACGSGAFPMGVMLRLMELRQIIGHGHRNSYDLKEEILSKNIFGVDIMPMAVEIARLRAWLSLVLEADYKPADRKNNFGVAALPNLDFKFICANSLIDSGYDDFLSKLQYNLTFFRLDGEIQKLEALRENYFDPKGDKNRKKELQKEFLKTKEYIKTEFVSLKKSWNLGDFLDKVDDWNPFDDSRPSSFFSPAWMFGVRNGFDVVIGNPPYIGQKNNNEKFKEVKKTSLGKKFHQRRMDFFYFFIHKGLDFLNPTGSLCLITTNYYFTATYADKLRADIRNRSSILRIINFNELKLFESALGQHNSIILLEKPFKKDTIAKTTSVTHAKNLSLDILRDVLKEAYPNAIYSARDNQKIYDSLNGNIQIDLSGSTNNNLFDIILNNCELLSKHFDLVEGIHTGADTLSNSHIEKYKLSYPKGTGIYILSDKEIEALSLNSEELEIIKPWFKNSDIDKWTVSNITDKRLIYYTTKQSYINVNNIKKHLSKFKIILINRKVRSGTGFISEQDYDAFVQGKKYISYVMNASAFKKGDYHFISYPRESHVFEGEKIVCPQRSNRNTFAYSNGSFYGSADIYFIKEKPKGLKLKYLLGLLNSALFFYWLYHKGKRKGEMLELYIRPLSELPIKIANQQIQKNIIDRVDKIICFKKQNIHTAGIEKEIDVLVYKLYELSHAEIKVIDPDFKLSESEYANFKSE